MTDYISSLEAQNEELSNKLAVSESLVQYYSTFRKNSIWTYEVIIVGTLKNKKELISVTYNYFNKHNAIITTNNILELVKNKHAIGTQLGFVTVKGISTFANKVDFDYDDSPKDISNTSYAPTTFEEYKRVWEVLWKVDKGSVKRVKAQTYNHSDFSKDVLSKWLNGTLNKIPKIRTKKCKLINKFYVGNTRK